MLNKAEAAEPKKGGTLRAGLGHGSTTDSLDPATFENGFTQFIGYGFRNNLTEISNTGELIGELAEGWNVSDDATVWTFKLRKGVEFHNGKTLDANDVVESLNHHRGEEIKTDGTDTVVVTLEAGNADFSYIVSDYHLVIMPAKDGGGIDWESGVGTGAFALTSFEPGVRATMKRNPNYWKEGRGRRGGANQRADHRRDRRDGPGRHQDRAPAWAQSGYPHRRDQQHGALHLRHAHGHAALRQQRRASGAEAGLGSRAFAADDPPRARHFGQRPSDRPAQPIPCD
jgi:hypothetical protein